MENLPQMNYILQNCRSGREHLQRYILGDFPEKLNKPLCITPGLEMEGEPSHLSVQHEIHFSSYSRTKRLFSMQLKELTVIFLCTFSLWSHGDYNAEKPEVTSKIMEVGMKTNSWLSPHWKKASFCTASPVTEYFLHNKVKWFSLRNCEHFTLYRYLLLSSALMEKVKRKMLKTRQDRCEGIKCSLLVS